ncbi:MAG: hypothetical protein HUU37_11465 [Bdellovibrionales bacterium]|nr:hypothetical protein [Bdellovibrionales bacterium]
MPGLPVLTMRTLAVSRFLAITLALISPATAGAGFFRFCDDFYGKLFPAITRVEAARLRKVLVGNTPPHFPRIRSPEEDLFWHGILELPKEALEKLRLLPSNREGSFRMLNELDEITGMKGGSFFRTVQNVWSDELRRDASRSADDWLNSGIARFRDHQKNSPGLAVRLKREWNQETRLFRARDYWNREAGVTALPLRKDKNGRVWIQVGSTEYLARRYGDGWALTVPRSAVAHPAWNPLDAKKLAGIAKRASAPKVYETMLGHDGRFYLLDGNHRFELDTKKLVEVRIPDPPSTATLRHWFDAINHPQPGEERLMEYHEGGMDWRALVEPRFRDRVILKP